MYRRLSLSVLALIVMGASLSVSSAAADPEPLVFTDACILLLPVDPGACDGPEEPPTPPEPGFGGPSDFQICALDDFDLTNPCDDDEPDPDPDPEVPTGPGDLVACGIDEETLTSNCDDGDEDEDPGDDDDIEPADPAEPIDDDPNFTG